MTTLEIVLVGIIITLKHLQGNCDIRVCFIYTAHIAVNIRVFAWIFLGCFVEMLEASHLEMKASVVPSQPPSTFSNFLLALSRLVSSDQHDPSVFYQCRSGCRTARFSWLSISSEANVSGLSRAEQWPRGSLITARTDPSISPPHPASTDEFLTSLPLINRAGVRAGCERGILFPLLFKSSLI